MTDTQDAETAKPLTAEGLLKMMVDGHYKYYPDADPESEALPMLWVVDDKGKVNLIMTQFRDETEKRMFCEIMAPKALDLLNSPMYGFTSESWVSTTHDGKRPDCMPSKDPDRREMVMSVVVTRQNGVVADSMLEIIRNPFTKKVSLVPMTEFGVGAGASLAGRMTELFTGGKVS